MDRRRQRRFASNGEAMKTLLSALVAGSTLAAGFLTACANDERINSSPPLETSDASDASDAQRRHRPLRSTLAEVSTPRDRTTRPPQRLPVT